MVDEVLATASLGYIRQFFRGLSSDVGTITPGFYRASFIGPWWLKIIAMPSIALSGLKGWQGKKFFDAYTATNILQTQQGLVEKLQMHCVHGMTLEDGQQGVALNYGADTPIPWRWIKDEMRVLDDQTYLCMTVIDLPFIRKLSFPFILRRES